MGSRPLLAAISAPGGLPLGLRDATPPAAMSPAVPPAIPAALRQRGHLIGTPRPFLRLRGLAPPRYLGRRRRHPLTPLTPRIAAPTGRSGWQE